MKKCFYLLGDDERYPYLVQELNKLGYQAYHAGMNMKEDIVNRLTPELILTTKPSFIVLPIGGIKEETTIGSILVNETFFAQCKDVPFFSGIATPYLKDIVKKYQMNITYFNDQEPFYRVNSIATAEGVIALILEHKKQIFKDCQFMVLGYGKSGTEIVRLLKALGGNVSVVVRSEQAKQAATSIADRVYFFHEMKNELETIDVLINTVPSLVIQYEELAKCKKNVYILDIASRPGGVDFKAAQLLGKKASLELKLPSRYTPQSSAMAMVEVILKEVLQ